MVHNDRPMESIGEDEGTRDWCSQRKIRMQRRLGLFLSTLIYSLTLVLPAKGDSAEGFAAFDRGDFATAFRELNPAAEQGNAMAQYGIGLMYARGLGVTKNDVEAARWLGFAAKQGNALAQFNFGVMYEEGQGVPQNHSEAVNWYRLAADQGLPSAQLFLAGMYDRGRGVPQNYFEAVIWYRKSADQGLAQAQYGLAMMYESGYGVPKDFGEARKWLKKAADQGLADAQDDLGAMYVIGVDGSPGYAEAVPWFRRAANQGSTHAQYILGSLYAQGKGVRQDYLQAHIWVNLAAATEQDEQKRNKYASFRDQLAEELTPQQLAEAQRLAREWKSTTSQPGNGTPATDDAGHGLPSDSSKRRISAASPVCQGRSKNRPPERRESRPLRRQWMLCFEGFAGAAGA
jgi:TPR repeat protein